MEGEAQKVLTARLGDVEKGLPITSKVGKKTLGDGLQAVIENQKLNERRSIGHTQRRIDKHLLQYFNPKRRMASMTTGELTKYRLHRREQGASPASVNLELAVVKKAFKLALDGGELMHAPKVPMVALQNARKGFFEREQFEAVRDPLPVALRGIATLGYYTGLRVGEIKPLVVTG